jgi:hypothetical protein
MIQGGDPTGTGTGGPGYRFRDELDACEGVRLRTRDPGDGERGAEHERLAVLPDAPRQPASSPAYSVFGRTIEGLEVDRCDREHATGSARPSARGRHHRHDRDGDRRADERHLDRRQSSLTPPRRRSGDRRQVGGPGPRLGSAVLPATAAGRRARSGVRSHPTVVVAHPSRVARTGGVVDGDAVLAAEAADRRGIGDRTTEVLPVVGDEQHRVAVEVGPWFEVDLDAAAGAANSSSASPIERPDGWALRPRRMIARRSAASDPPPARHSAANEVPDPRPSPRERPGDASSPRSQARRRSANPTRPPSSGPVDVMGRT